MAELGCVAARTPRGSAIATENNLHDDVEERLPQGNAWHFSHGDADGLAHLLVVELRVMSEARRVDQLVQLGVLI